MEEEMGFEPMRDIAAPTPLAGECFQPLSHSSFYSIGAGGGIRTLTVFEYRQILNLVRLPFRHSSTIFSFILANILLLKILVQEVGLEPTTLP
jgi:hypothetical protein